MKEIIKLADTERERNYDDILYHERPLHGNRKKLTPAQRAAQFSPFESLTGFSGEIAETERHIGSLD